MQSKPNPPRILVLDGKPAHLISKPQVEAKVREWASNPAYRDWLRTMLGQGGNNAA